MLAFAINENRAVLTLNRKDFIRLHRANATHCGIVISTNDIDRSRMAIRITQAIAQEEPLTSQLIRVVRPAS